MNKSEKKPISHDPLFNAINFTFNYLGIYEAQNKSTPLAQWASLALEIGRSVYSRRKNSKKQSTETSSSIYHRREYRYLSRYKVIGERRRYSNQMFPMIVTYTDGERIYSDMITDYSAWEERMRDEKLTRKIIKTEKTLKDIENDLKSFSNNIPYLFQQDFKLMEGFYSADYLIKAQEDPYLMTTGASDGNIHYSQLRIPPQKIFSFSDITDAYFYIPQGLTGNIALAQRPKFDDRGQDLSWDLLKDFHQTRSKFFFIPAYSVLAITNTGSDFLYAVVGHKSEFIRENQKYQLTSNDQTYLLSQKQS